MVSLRDRVTDALNEVRILILGAQIFLGFQLQAAFQPRFRDLPLEAQALNAACYGLMFAAVICLTAPVSFHRIVDRGADDIEIHRYLTRTAAAALLPFALCIGIDQFLVGHQIFGPAIATAIAVTGTASALSAWYGVELWVRFSLPYRDLSRIMKRRRSVRTPLKEKIKTMSTEIRVVLPGAQALLGFQFSAVLSERFAELPFSIQAVHFGALSAAALSVILLMAPAAYHRIAAAGEDTLAVNLFGVFAMLSAMGLLGIALAGDFYVVLGMAVGWNVTVAFVAIMSFLAAVALWFGYPLTRQRGGPIR